MNVLNSALDGVFYDLEIIYADQTPKWTSAQPLLQPFGWSPAEVAGGIGFVTTFYPLRSPGVTRFVVQVVPANAGQMADIILLHMTDQQHRNLGYVVSQRGAHSAPFIILQPTAGLAGSRVTIQGFEFPALRTVNVTFAGEAWTQVTTDVSGTFSVTATVPAAPPGTYQVVAREPDSGDSATANFKILSPGE